MKRIFVTVIIFLFTTFISNVAVASENVLNSLVISSDNSKYEITLNTFEKAKVKQVLTSEDSIVLTVKNIKLSENLSTIYNNAYKVNGVIIKQDGNNIKININGMNISNANVNVNPQMVIQSKAGMFLSECLSIFNQRYLMTLFILFALMFVCSKLLSKTKNNNKSYNLSDVVTNVTEREFNLLKNVIDSFTETNFLKQKNISINDAKVQYQKLNNLKTVSNLEKQFNSDSMEFLQEYKITYKTPARSRLGGMTNVCSKIMSPQISSLEKARVISRIG